MNLPSVWTEPFADSLCNRLREEAAVRFRMHALPEEPQAWPARRAALRERLWQSLGTRPEAGLPLECREHGRIACDGYTVRNIVYQSRPGLFVTGNLYVPDGRGPFPAVINLHGHWSQGRLAERVQSRGHSLARNGYVCLSVDAFGSGERSTRHGQFEYHGANLGASLMNVGETLMGMQVVDNLRGVDLLCSLDEVDPERIGATGASGGGNQTMWLTAMDDRIAAAMPVVSVGTFQSYVGGSNCVCELLPDGLTFTEESGVLALVAPRALKLCNCLQDSNPTFFPAEMLRSVREARKVYRALGTDEKLAYQVFNLPHGYWPEVREAMLGWFDLHLKGVGHGAPRTELPFAALPEKDVMVFPAGKRPETVCGISTFCIRRGAELHRAFRGRTAFDPAAERKALAAVLRLGPPLVAAEIVAYGAEEGWEKLALRTACDRLIPLLVRRPQAPGGAYVLCGHPLGKTQLADTALLRETPPETGVLLADFWGSGETARMDTLTAPYHTLSRSALWLGKTILGEWTREWTLLAGFARTHLGADSVALGGVGEAGLAALFAAALGADAANVTLEQAPPSYRFADREPPGTRFSMAVHLPGFLRWGDVSLAAALAATAVRFHAPVRMDGTAPDAAAIADWEREYAEIRRRCALPGDCRFSADPAPPPPPAAG